MIDRLEGLFLGCLLIVIVLVATFWGEGKNG